MKKKGVGEGNGEGGLDLKKVKKTFNIYLN